MKVSILLPSYNHARWVADSIRSVREQTVAPDELLIVDDGSRDDSVRVIREAIHGATFHVDFVARENRGVSATMNEMLGRSTGDIIIPFSSDDLFASRRVEWVKAAFETSEHIAVAYGHCEVIDGDGHRIGSTRRTKYPSGQVFDQLASGGFLPYGPTVAYRRDVIGDGWHESQCEDFELLMRASLRGTFKFIDEVVASWRRHGDNRGAVLNRQFDDMVNVVRTLTAAAGYSEAQTQTAIARQFVHWARVIATADSKTRALKLLWEHGPAAHDPVAVLDVLARVTAPRLALEAALRLRRLASLKA